LTEPSLIPTVPSSPPDPPNKAILKETIEEKWSDGVRCFFEVIWISSPSMIIPCSIRENIIEAHLNPFMEVNIMPWHLVYSLLGNVSLRPSDKLLKSCPSRHIIECRRVASVVLLIMDKIEVNLDFHIFDILFFSLLLGSPLEKLLDASQRSLDEKLRETASAVTTSCLENPMVKPLSKQNPLEMMMYVSLFISSEPVPFEVAKSPEEYDSEEILHHCEDKRSSSPSIEFEPLPTGPKYVVLVHDRDPTMISHDESLEMGDPWTMEFCVAPTLGSEEKYSIDENESFILGIPQEPCLFNASLESGMLCAPSTYEDYNHLKVLSCKIFRRLVVDAFVYHKHCKFRGCIVALTLQLKLHQQLMVRGEDIANDSCKR
jgi:hypothetical protein